MSKKYYTYEKLNEEIEKIIDKGFIPPTRLYKFQEGRTSIIVGNELMGAGFIRSYEETVKFLERKGLSENYSKARYTEELHELQDDLGKLRTERGVTSENRKRLLDIVAEAGVNGKKFSTKRLNDAVKEAQKRVMEGNNNSPQFYEFLKDELDA